MRSSHTAQRGAIAVLAAFVLVAVGSFMAIALNMGRIMTTRGQLQNASDSAALAAAGSLNGHLSGLTEAATMASKYAALHSAAGKPVEVSSGLGSDAVLFGRWHFDSSTFEPMSPTGANAFEINAVKVLDASLLSIFFGGWLGRDTTNVGSGAVAIGRGARTDCSLPFVLPSCPFMTGDDYKCGQRIRLELAPDGTDDIGFIDFVGSNGVKMIVDNILQRCTTGITNAGDLETKVGNGNNFNHQVIEALLGVESKGNEVQPLSPTLDDGSSSLCIFNTKVFTFPIANLGCPNPTFTGSPRIGQFASVRIDSITDNKSNIYQSCPTDGAHKLEDWGAPATVKKRGMEVTLLCDGNGGLSEVSNSQLTLRLVQ